MTENKITIVITSYKSDKTILSCLESIDQKYKVIIIENSSNHEFKKKIEKQFANVACIVAEENLGYANGNNLALSRVKTPFALILNPDAILEKETIKNFFTTADKLKTFAIIGPAIQEVNNENKNKFLIEVESVKGFAMFLKMDEFKSIGFFDTNFFIYLEEIDLCKRLIKDNKRIFVDPSIIVKHQGGSSHDEKYNFQMELSRNWHWMWSTFYFNKKHYGYLFSLLKIQKKLFSSLFKMIYYKILFNKKKSLVYFQRTSGIINSILGRQSWYRPNTK